MVHSLFWELTMNATQHMLTPWPVYCFSGALLWLCISSQQQYGRYMAKIDTHSLHHINADNLFSSSYRRRHPYHSPPFTRRRAVRMTQVSLISRHRQHLTLTPIYSHLKTPASRLHVKGWTIYYPVTPNIGTLTSRTALKLSSRRNGY